MPKALLGHWVTEDGKSHMYYNEDYYISVYSGKFYPGRYTLEEINETDRTMRVRIKPLHSRILTFSSDKNAFVDIAEVAGIRATEEQAIRWKHVDDSRKPSSETLQSTQGDEPLLEAVTVEETPRPEFIIGDSKTKIFYWRACPEHEKLPLRRRVYFKTRADAQEAGYRAAKTCP